MNKTMKQILSFLNLVILGALLTVSCNLNENPKFDDKDAFVAFDNATMTVSESVGTIKVPVTLASVKGIAATISYQAVNGTAKSGVNYELLDGAGTLTFSAEERTQYITVKINKIAGYTGDLKFTLKFKEGGLAGLNEGAENKCVITITDIDHPLTFILGGYSVSADSYYSSRGHFDWTITLSKDASDVSVVWIANMDPYFAGYGYIAPSYNYFYGTVNAEKTTITIPKGQNLGYETTVLNGITDVADDGPFVNVTISINATGSVLTIVNPWGIWDDGWWNKFPGGIIMNKK